MPKRNEEENKNPHEDNSAEIPKQFDDDRLGFHPKPLAGITAFDVEVFLTRFMQAFFGHFCVLRSFLSAFNYFHAKNDLLHSSPGMTSQPHASNIAGIH